MPPADRFAARVLIFCLLLVCMGKLLALGRPCEFSAIYRNNLYNYSLAEPSQKYLHGVMSEDGFYKVAVNETVLWYQLCEQMIFNHDQPRCLNCQDCGGPLRCGMLCSALTSNNIGGYPVCTTIGHASTMDISLIEKNNPEKGVIVKMNTNGSKKNCSLSVSVICDSKKVQVSNSLTIFGDCDYAIPNLDFWLSLPQRTRIMLGSLVQRLRGFSHSARGSYASVRDDRDFYAPASSY